MTKKTFRLLLILLIIMPAAGSLDFLYLDLLPEELSEFIVEQEHLEENVEPTKFHFILIMISLPFLIYILSTTVALFRFQPHARKHATVLTIIFLLLLPFSGPYVYSGVSMAFSEVSSVLWGLLLGTMYFSDLKSYFD